MRYPMVFIEKKEGEIPKKKVKFHWKSEIPKRKGPVYFLPQEQLKVK